MVIFGRVYRRPLRALVRPDIPRRLKTDKRVLTDLPDKTELNAWCHIARRRPRIISVR